MDLAQLISPLMLAGAAIAMPFWMWIRMEEATRQHQEEIERDRAVERAIKAAEEAARAAAQATVAARTPPKAG